MSKVENGDTSNGVDIDNVIEKSTRKVSLDTLSKKGLKTVKVLRSDQINDMIMRAVDIVVAKREGKSRSEGVAESARREYLAEAKKELKILMKQRAELEALINEAEAEKTIFAEELAKIRGEASELAASLKAEKQAHRETAKKKDEETDKLREMLDKFISDFPEKKETQEIEVLRREIQSMSERDSSLADQIKNIVGEMTKDIKQDLAGKLVAGSASAGPRGGKIEAKEVILDALFRQAADIDTNVAKLDVKEKKVGGVGDALAKLKNMRKKK